MSEKEFWASTLAKVLALEEAVNERDRRRDFFVASIESRIINYLQKEGSPSISVSDILGQIHKTVTVTPDIDPDFGAMWVGEKLIADEGDLDGE